MASFVALPTGFIMGRLVLIRSNMTCLNSLMEKIWHVLAGPGAM